MKPQESTTAFKKVYDKRTKLFGIKREGERIWYIKPCFQNVESSLCGNYVKDEAWFRQEGKYGRYNFPERRVVIPPVYTYPIDFYNGQAVTWKDYKAGVIDHEGVELIPFIYDRIYQRQGKGYACFMADGTAHAFDARCQPDEFTEEEKEREAWESKYSTPEAETMTVEELEKLIQREYVKLIEMGFHHEKELSFTKEHRDKLDDRPERQG